MKKITSLFTFTLALSFLLLSNNSKAQNIYTLAGGTLSNNEPATLAALTSPNAIATDAAGNIYIADGNYQVIKKITTAGIISVFAGNGTAGFSGDGGQATAAELSSPIGIAFDVAGNLYIVDYGNNCIRKVTTAGIISTIAGNGAGFGGDGGQATAAQLHFPDGVGVDAAGNIYIADSRNQRIRKVTSAGIISTFAGNGAAGFSGDGGQATAAQINNPNGITTDAAGNVYIADPGNARIRKITSAGIISTFAGNGTGNFSGDGGQATAAQINNPVGVTIDAAGNLYMIDAGNNRIRKVTTAGIISTIAGGVNGDGGTALGSQLFGPTAVTKDAAGNLYIADAVNNRIRKVNTAGIISTFAGKGTLGFSGDGGQATAAAFYNPSGITIDAAGNIYIADTQNNRVRKITSAGIISTVVGNGTASFGGDGGNATAAQLYFPNGVATDATGNIYIADVANNRIRKVNTGGIISTIAGNGTGGFSGDGGQSTAAELYNSAGIATDAAGNIYIADTQNNRVRKITSAGIISTIAGNGTPGFSGDGGQATAALINRPTGVTIDALGNVYIADQNNNRIRIVTTNGIINTLAGNGAASFGGDGGNATGAQLYYPSGVATDATGNIYIADNNNKRIRIVSPALNLTANTATICLGNPTTLTAHGASNYVWSPATGLSATTGSVVTANPPTPITYTITGVTTDTVNGIVTTSTGTTTTTVNVNMLPSISISNTSTAAVCPSTTVTLTASGSASSYTWSTTEITASITPSPTVSTIYTVTGTGANGCTNTTTTSIAVNLPTTSTLTPVGCNSVTVNATTYTLSGTYTQHVTNAAGCDSAITINAIINMPTTSTLSPVGCNSVTVNATTYTLSGTYTQHLTNSAGCDSAITINATINSVPIVSATSSTVSLCKGDTAILTAHGANTYTWSTTATTATIAVMPTVNTSYTVTGAGVGACTNTAVVTQTVSTTCIASIEQLAGANVAVSIYPNPTLAEFTIEAVAGARIIVTNTIGQTIINEVMPSDKQNYSLGLFATGVYFVKVIYHNQQQTFKLIKQE